MGQVSSDQQGPGGLERVHVQVALEGAELACDVLRVRYVEGLSELFEADVTIALARADAAKIKPHAKCSLTFLRGVDDPSPHKVHGLVQLAEEVDDGDGRDAERPVVRFRLVSAVWRMSLGRRTQVFKDVSVNDLVTKITADNGLPKPDGAADAAVRPLVVQYEESDLAFLSRLLEDLGITHAVRQDTAKESWVLLDADSDKTLIGDVRPLVWSVLPDGQLDGEGVARGGRRQAMGVTVVKAFDADRRYAPKVLTHEGTGEGEKFTQEWRDPWRPGKTAITNVGKQLLDEAGQGRESYWLETSDIQVCAGQRVDAELSQHDAIAGVVTRLLVVRVEHEYEMSKDGSVYQNRVEAVTLKKPFRPARVTPRPRILAPQTGIVKQYLPEKGLEVEVLMDWHTEPRVIPVRVPQPLAGKNHGAVLLPRLDDEVLVHFIDGVPERPVLLGALYNNGVPTPVNPKEKPFTSHLAMLGDRGTTNTIDVDDNTNGSEKITAKVINDLDLTIGRHEKWTVEGNVTEDLKKDVKVDVGGKRASKVVGDETYETDGKVSVTVKQTGRVLVNQTLQMTADTKLSLVSGNTRADFSPSGVKITVGSAVIEMNAASIKLSMGGSSIEVGPTIKITSPLVSINNGALDVM